MASKNIVETETQYIDKKSCRTASQMENVCCEETEALPCCTKLEIWNGYTQEEALEKLGIELDEQGRDEDGNYVEIQFKKRNKPCGILETDYNLVSKNCCDEIDEIVINTELTPSILPHGSSIVIYFDGGEGPFVARTTANSTYFSNGKKEIAFDGANNITIFADSDFCPATSISISDKCTTGRVIVRSDLGYWQYISNECQLYDFSATWNPSVSRYEAYSGKYLQTESASWNAWNTCATYNSEYVTQEGTCFNNYQDYINYIRSLSSSESNACLNYYNNESNPILYHWGPGEFIRRVYYSCGYSCDDGEFYGQDWTKQLIIINAYNRALYEWVC